MRKPVLVTLIAAVSAIGATATAQAIPEIHAHRGGTVVLGKPLFAEETLAAYRHALRDGFVLEVDAKLTSDGVPVAVHDATLDRTTNCTGEVRSFTEAALRACRPDVLGSPGSGLKTRSVSPRERIPTIAEVLELARLTGAKVNLEIKNVPTDPDWDPTPAYANRVMDVVVEAGLARSQLLIQSFISGNLDVAKSRLSRVQTSLLALAPTPDAVELARSSGYHWISPQWPVTPAFTRDAHRAGRLVAPYTLNTRAQARAAARAGVDAIITDDPWTTAHALGVRPVKALKFKLRRRGARVEASGRLLRPRGVSRRKACKGSVKLQLLGAKRILHAQTVRLARDCLVKVAVPVPRGAPASLLATVGFSGNGRLLPRLEGPRRVPREVPRAVPSD